MIFCDMDGVLTDFDGEFERRFGMPPHAIPRPELWEKVLAAKDYWYDLPKTGGADKLVSYLSRFGFCILTGLPAYGYDKAEKEKRLWLKKHYGKEDGVICCLSKDKQNFGARQDILIDDLPANIARWEQMGGIGILHTSAEETIRKLQELGYK